MPEQLQLIETPQAEKPKGKRAARPAGAALDPRQVSRADLPESLRDVMDLIGAANVIKLVRAHGGKEFYVPRSPRLGRALAEIVGNPSARLLVEKYGGEAVYLPRLAHLRRKLRDRRIRADYDDGGSTVSELVQNYSLSKRQVSSILNQAE